MASHRRSVFSCRSSFLLISFLPSLPLSFLPSLPLSFLQPLSLSLPLSVCMSLALLPSSLFSLPQLVELAAQFNSFNSSFSAAADADQSYLDTFAFSQDVIRTVETKHPYSFGKNQLKETVTIPGATALSLIFDPRSRSVSSTADVLQLFCDAALNHPVMFDGSALYYSGNSFPVGAVIIPGDTVTFVFNADTRPDSRRADMVSRWGFRCTVTEALSPEDLRPTFSCWTLEVQNALAALGADLSMSLIRGEPITASEESVRQWLSNPLFLGGLDDGKDESSHSDWIEKFVMNADDSFSQLFTLIKSTITPTLIPPSAKEQVESVERLTLAAMLKHSRLIEKAREVSDLLMEGKEMPSDLKVSPSPLFLLLLSFPTPCLLFFVFLSFSSLLLLTHALQKVFSPLAEKSKQLISWFLRTSQIQKDWMNLVAETEDIAALDVFKTDLNRFKSICEHVKVTYDEKDIPAALVSLFAAIEEAKKTMCDPRSNPYKHVADPIIERLRFLLRLTPSDENTTFIANWWTGVPPATRPDVPEPPSNLLSAIVGFVTGLDVTYKEFDKILRAARARAATRVVGLNYLHSLLHSSSFASAMHQVLGALGHPLSNGGHYLSAIETAGSSLVAEVTKAFETFLKTAMEKLTADGLDYVTKLMLLAPLSISYQKFDLSLLSSLDIFHVLQKIADLELSPALPPSASSPPHDAVTDAMDIDNDVVSPQEEKKEAVVSTANVVNSSSSSFTSSEVDPIREQLVRLKSAAWTGFRLLATRCFVVGDATPVAKHLQTLVLDLMCNELGHLSASFSPYTVGDLAPAPSDEHANHTFELLSLLYILGGDSNHFSRIANESNVRNLVSFLGTNSPPRSQRLLLRLCRKLLPYQSPEMAVSLLRRLVDLASSWTFFAREDPVPAAPPKVDSSEGTSGQVEGQIEEDFDDEDEDQKVDYDVVLHSWSHGAQRLRELCLMSFGPDFFAATANAAASGRIANQNAESKVCPLVSPSSFHVIIVVVIASFRLSSHPLLLPSSLTPRSTLSCKTWSTQAMSSSNQEPRIKCRASPLPSRALVALLLSVHQRRASQAPLLTSRRRMRMPFITTGPTGTSPPLFAPNSSSFSAC